MKYCRLIPFVFVVCAVTGSAFAGNDSGLSSIDSSPAIGTLKLEGEISSTSVPSKVDKAQVMKSLSLTGLDKVKHSLSDWNGKVILINFWATWCSPCLSEIRDFVIYQEQYKTRGLQIIGVGLDEEKKLRNVQRTLEINYPVLVADPVENVGLMEQWGNKSGILPYTVVIGRDGHVKYAHRGVMSREVFDEYVLSLLDKV
jgi:peroxiredoxin